MQLQTKLKVISLSQFCSRITISQLLNSLRSMQEFKLYHQKLQYSRFLWFLQEKAESELRKLRQSFCFKARPLPDFYKERETQTHQMKKACSFDCAIF